MHALLKAERRIEGLLNASVTTLALLISVVLRAEAPGIRYTMELRCKMGQPRQLWVEITTRLRSLAGRDVSSHGLSALCMRRSVIS